VFIFGKGDNSIAVVSTVIAQQCPNNSHEQLRFKGPAIFDNQIKKHIVETILSSINGIFKALGFSEKCFELSIVNLGAASLKDIGLSISGFSADVPIALAFLSAGLQILVPNDFVSTGHIASPDGDIRMVKGIPNKLAAAVKIDTIGTFLHPDITQDNSLGSLTPVEKQRISDALTVAKWDIKTVGVRDIADLMYAVFSDEQVVLSSLRNGFYKVAVQSSLDTPIVRGARFFGEENEQRFWRVLENHMLAAQNENVKELLFTFTSYHIHRKTYPKELGVKLFKLVQSMPPETIRLKFDFPLLAMSECIRVSQFAHESDHEDVTFLFIASCGEKIWPSAQKSGWDLSGKNLTEHQGDNKLQTILSEIDSDNLVKLIGLPIDSARASYFMDSVVVKSSDEFNHATTSFYTHLLRHTRMVLSSVNLTVAGAEAFALLERAFSQKGGFSAAMEEAKNGTNGGLRHVFDSMTEQFKREEQEKHINGVLKSVMDPLDWESKVNLIKDILKRLESHLPAEIVSQPPERFATHYEIIVRAYVYSMDKVKSLFRSF